jgi:5-hydroxyisourate hydrolase-like protein (transthyretin family)
MARDDGTSRGVRRIVVPLALLAFVVAGAFVATRSTVDESAPSAPPTKPDAPAPPARPPRVRAIDTSAPPPAKSVRVAVTDFAGKPVKDARVELVRGPDRFERDFLPRAKPPAAGIRADVDGAGVALAEDVPRGNWFVVADAPGYGRHALAGVVRGDDDAGVDATVALDVGHSLAGTIRDADGAPAAGVAVVLAPRVDFVNDAICMRTTTAADGAYRFDGVEPGTYVLWYAVRDDVVVQAAVLVVPGVETFDVRMTRGAAVDGTVVDADSGAPVAGARVVAIQFHESGIDGVAGTTDVLDAALTDRLGRFALHTWRPTSTVTSFLVDAAGYAPEPVDAPSALGPAADGQRFTVNLRVRREAIVHGTVTGPDGPLAGLIVAAIPEDEGVSPYPGGPQRAALTAADGTFRIAGLPAGKTRLLVAVGYVGGVVVAHSEVELDAVHDVAHDVRVDVRRVHIKRRVMDIDAAPIAGAEVTQRLGPWSARAVSDADGVLEMDVVFAGEMPALLMIRAKGFRDEQELLFADSEDEMLHALRRGDELAGKLQRDDDSGVPGVRLVVHGGVVGVEGQRCWDWIATRETVTGSDGAFRFPYVAAFQHYVAASNVEGVDPRGVEREEIGTDSLQIRIPTLDHVAGRVVAAGTNEPIAGASVVVSDSIVVGTTGADGRFAVDVPTDSSKCLTVVAPSWRDEPIAGDEAEKVVQLRRALAIGGVVRNPAGAPIAGLRVRLRHVGDEEKWEVIEAATDVEGRFLFPNLPSGTCEATVVDPIRHSAAGSKATVQTGVADVVLVARPATPLVVNVEASGDGPTEPVYVTAHPADAALADVAERMYPNDAVVFGLAADVAYEIRAVGKGFKPVQVRDVRAGAEPLKIVVDRE